MSSNRTDPKPLDCVEMKRKIQEAIYRETRGMTVEEELSYFREEVMRGPFASLFKKPPKDPARAPTSS